MTSSLCFKTFSEPLALALSCKLPLAILYHSSNSALDLLKSVWSDIPCSAFDTTDCIKVYRLVNAVWMFTVLSRTSVEYEYSMRISHLSLRDSMSYFCLTISLKSDLCFSKFSIVLFPTSVTFSILGLNSVIQLFITCSAFSKSFQASTLFFIFFKYDLA